jgi:hypothetical protein
MEKSINKFMPKNISSYTGQLEELCKKIEYTLEDLGACPDDIIGPISDAIDALVEVNDELDSDLEEE